MHVTKKDQIYGRNSLFNLETTAALLLKNYRLRLQTLASIKLSDHISDESGVYVIYYITNPIFPS